MEISVITPLYNAKKTISSTYLSLQKQSYIDWQWIVVDDCSSDGSFYFVKELTKQDNRVLVLQTSINSGTAVARNLGLKHAKGRYITFLDSDDFLDAEYLEKQLEFIKKNGPVVTCSYRRLSSKSCTNFIVPEYIDYEVLLKGNPLSCLTTMYDKDTIGDVFFPEDLRKCEDYVFWLNILKKGIIAKGNQEVLATYNIHSGSKSFNKIKLIKYMYRVYHKTQNINWFTSWFYVFRWAFYGLKKYKGVR